MREVNGHERQNEELTWSVQDAAAETAGGLAKSEKIEFPWCWGVPAEQIRRRLREMLTITGAMPQSDKQPSPSVVTDRGHLSVKHSR